MAPAVRRSADSLGAAGRVNAVDAGGVLLANRHRVAVQATGKGSECSLGAARAFKVHFMLHIQKGKRMAIEWSESLTTVDWDELSALFKVTLGDKPADSLQIVFANSRYRCFAWDQGRLVGVGRALADGVDTSYLCDITVLPEYQGSGLGKEIVRRLVALSSGHKKILLYSVPGKEAFYRKFGFLRMRTAMALFDDQDLAQRRGYVEPAQ